MLFGHDVPELSFMNAWTSGRIAHAWLICGPKGIGKATFAYRIARFVLAEGRGPSGLFGSASSSLCPGSEPPVFRSIATCAHPDLKVIERGYADEKKNRLRSEIVIDDVRGIGSFFALTPAEGGWRVVIIDSADDMNRNAANAVLKVLEEPPRNSLLLMISHCPGSLLPTIRSRCRHLTLQPLSEQLVTNLLSKARPEISTGDVTALARLGDGSIGRALGLAAEGGLDLYRDVITLLGSLPNFDIPAVHIFADRVARADGDTAWQIVTDLFGWWVVRLIRAGGGADDGLAEVITGERAIMNRLLASATLEQWLEVWENTSRLFARCNAINLDKKQALLSAFLAVDRLVQG